MKKRPVSYVSSFETVPSQFPNGRARYHWMICRDSCPDKLVSWGYAASQEEAERAAQNELCDLASGVTEGGRVVNPEPRRPHRF